MSKTKSKSHSEVEHLNGLIRQLKKQVNKLTRDNSQLRKELNRNLDKNTKEYEDMPDVPKNKRSDKGDCPVCGGVLTSIDLGVRSLLSCKDCEYRKVLK